MEIAHSFNRLTSFIVDTAFPPYCLCCEEEGNWACTACRRHFRLANHWRCPLCSHEGGNGYVCTTCYAGTGVRQVVSVFQFEQKGIQNIVHALKYDNMRSIAPWMGRCMSAAWQLRGGEYPECIIPIPLHPSRLREREYNQAALLGDVIHQALEIPLEDRILLRTRKTISQTKLSSDERKANIQGSFSVRSGSLLPTSALLIDDVCTTGATICEAARTLKNYGVESVSVLVFAHG